MSALSPADVAEKVLAIVGDSVDTADALRLANGMRGYVEAAIEDKARAEEMIREILEPWDDFNRRLQLQEDALAAFLDRRQRRQVAELFRRIEREVRPRVG